MFLLFTHWSLVLSVFSFKLILRLDLAGFYHSRANRIGRLWIFKLNFVHKGRWRRYLNKKLVLIMNSNKDKTSAHCALIPWQCERWATDVCCIHLIVMKIFPDKTLKVECRCCLVFSFRSFLFLFGGWFYTVTVANQGELTLTLLCLGLIKIYSWSQTNPELKEAKSSWR